MSFYELQEPTAWAESPIMWSSTSVDAVEACPRRWQLLSSRWGDLERFPVRLHPAAIEGQIVHEALDRLTRVCGQRGNPPFGSPDFSAALSDADFFSGIERAVTDWSHRLGTHPRPGPVYRLRVSGEELANQAVRMFRQQYRPGGEARRAGHRAPGKDVDFKALLRQNGALSEMKLTHPSLPFFGVLDLVHDTGDGVELIDFKTGRPSEKHRHQLLRYALLWWRQTSDVPVRVSAHYLEGVESWSVTQGVLQSVEAELTKAIERLTNALDARPATGTPGPGCGTCAVRARCAAGWAVSEETARLDGRGDAELIVKGTAGEHGFIALARNGREIAVVYEAPVAGLLPELADGLVLRILDGVWQEHGTQLELQAWTEVFLVADP